MASDEKLDRFGRPASLIYRALSFARGHGYHETDEAFTELHGLRAENAAMREALSKQRVYAVATGALTTPSAMHAMMQRMVDDIDTALGGRDA